MYTIGIIGIAISRRIFQLHGANVSGKHYVKQRNCNSMARVPSCHRWTASGAEESSLPSQDDGSSALGSQRLGSTAMMSNPAFLG